jgi:hypothetical protein
VAQDERLLDDEPPDATVVVVVGVRSAHPDRDDPDGHLTGPGLGDGTLLQSDVPRSAKDGDPHLMAPMDRPCTSLSWAAKPAMSTGTDTTNEAAQTWARNNPWLVTKPVR